MGIYSEKAVENFKKGYTDFKKMLKSTKNVNFQKISPYFVQKGLIFCMLLLVGVTGFEPAASWSRTKRTTKLCHTSLFNCIFIRIQDGFGLAAARSPRCDLMSISHILAKLNSCQ